MPLLHENLLIHKKERVLLMIINMMRVRPKIFMTQLADLKAKCQNRQKPKNLIFQAEDVELAKELLMDVRSVHPLDLQAELCDQVDSQKINRNNSMSATLDESDRSNKERRTSRRKPFKGTSSFSGIREMVIDFVCREDLVMTTLKEFFEIFISSIKKEQIFHKELLSERYYYIGLSLTFNSMTSVATLRVILAASLK